MSGRPRVAWLLAAAKLGRRIETALLTVLLAALIAVAFTQILLRNGFATGLPWADEGAQMLVLWIAVVGAMAASRDGRHIAINLAGRVLPPRLSRWAQVLIDLFATGVAGLFAWHAGRFVADTKNFGDLIFDGLPAWPFQLILTVGFALISYRYAVRAARGIFQGARQ